MTQSRACLKALLEAERERADTLRRMIDVQAMQIALYEKEIERLKIAAGERIRG